MYYVHNNWMAGNLSAEEAMKKISKYIEVLVIIFYFAMFAN